MKNRLILSLISVLVPSVCCSSFAAAAKQRVLVLTDISNEPDDEESMVLAARMDWCVADEFKKANHNPVPVLNGDKTRNVVEITAQAGETVRLSSEGTGDPDGNTVETRWWIYEEAGSLVDPKTRRLPANVKLAADKGATTSLVVPALPKAGTPPIARPATVHVILETRDNGTPNLWAYRRAVVKIE